MIEATYTPDWLARDMVALADIRPGHTILEPCAGKGALIQAIPVFPFQLIQAVELNAENFQSLLGSDRVDPVRADFLTWSPDPTRVRKPFDRVVLNPPRKHTVGFLKRSAEMLGRGGRLVALVYASMAVDDVLPGQRLYHMPGVFNDPGQTFGAIEAALLVWDKP